VVRSANGMSTIVEAMKIASAKHDLLWYFPPESCGIEFLRLGIANSSLSDQDAAHFHISATEKADFVEEVLTEISVYLGMLYHVIEVFKGHDDFADELSEYLVHHTYQVRNLLSVSLDPPLPVYLFNVVSGLRDKSAKGYPIKKVSERLHQTSFSVSYSCHSFCWYFGKRY
jgi:hypothetical protein